MLKEDIQLIKEAKQNKEAYAKLYYKYARNIYDYFWYRIDRQKDICEDLMQETFLRAFQHLPKFRMRGYSYLSYLKTIAHNLLVNYYRKPKELSFDELGEVPAEITKNIDQKLEAEKLWKAVQKLSRHSKDALLMRYQDEMPIKDIARVMGKSENAVKLLLSRARRKLANHPDLTKMRGFASPPLEIKPPKFLKKSLRTHA